MSIKLNEILLGAFLLLALLSTGTGWAYAPEPVLLDIKGYSPEIIDTIQTQTDRMEWRQPQPPARTPKERFLHNIFINDWTGNFDPFGSHVLRERQ